MITTPPAHVRVLCCVDDVWQIVSYPSSGEAALSSTTWSAREREAHIVALETANGALRREVQTVTEQAHLRMAEVEHRLKNLLATVHALAAQTARPGDTGESFRASFGARLQALAQFHDLLRPSGSDGALLTEVIGRCLKPYEDKRGRITVSGPAVHLAARAVPVLGLAFHELATNAAKYGALSDPQGRVEVTWVVETRAEGRAQSVAILWRERGGPSVDRSSRRGFGSRLLEHGLAQEAGATTQLDFALLGVDCRIWLPVISGS